MERNKSIGRREWTGRTALKRGIVCGIVFISMALHGRSQDVQSFLLSDRICAGWQDYPDRIYLSILKQAHYLLSGVHGFGGDPSMKLLTESKTGEHWIRPNAGAVTGFAFLYRFGNYNPEITGVPREELLKEYIIPLARYLCRTHLTGSLNTGDGKKWGNAWQSAHWASIFAKGCWWIWPELPEDVKAGVRKIVRYEARRFYDRDPPHRLHIDTKSEENAWNSHIFHVAMLLMPDDAEYGLWERLLRKWVLSAYIRPADINSDSVVSGAALSGFSGPNIHDDYTLENHGIVHPDYMNAFILSSQFALDYQMQGRKIPAFLFFNNQRIYENLKWFALPDGGMNYSSGQDWPIFRNPDWLFTHIHSAAFRKDKDAAELARRVISILEKMQARNPEGNVYQRAENHFPSGQTDLIYYTSLSWLALHFMENVPDRFVEKEGTKVLESGKIILNRSSKAVHSFSWGRTIMFQSIVNGLDRVFDSHTRNGIGYIVLKGEDRPLPVSLKEAPELQVGDDSFKASFTVDHGGKISAFYTIRSRGNKMEVFEKLVAAKSIVTGVIATSSYGVLNNKNWVCEDGMREIRPAGRRPLVFISGKGDARSITSERITIDGLIVFCSGQTFNARYEPAKASYRSRTTDQLILNYLPGERSFTKGTVIAQVKYEIVAPERTGVGN